MARKRKGERADGRIQLQLDIGHDENGKRVRKFFYGKTRAEAEQKRDEYLSEQKGQPRNTNITVAQWVDEYLKAYRVKVNVLYHAQDDIPYERLKREIGTRAIASIREIDLQALLNKVSGMSFSTCQKYLQAIKRVFKKARKNKLISEDPAEDLQMPAYTKGTHRALTKEEIDLILKYWRECNSGLWILLMLFCGLRRGEMMALDWSAVDLEARTVTVRQTAVISGNKIIIEQRAKTSAGLRIIPIPDYLYEALLTIENKNGYVCKSTRGLPLSESAVSSGIERFCNIVTRYINGNPKNPNRANSKEKQAKLFHFRPHDLRHTYCSLLYAAGVDVKTAAYLLGHADINVTMRIYTHLSEEQKTASTQSLTEYINRLNTPIS